MVPVVLQVLRLELKEIRAQQDLLFRFMNFLKQEGAVHVLQFCLTVGKVPPHVQHAVHVSQRRHRRACVLLQRSSTTGS